MDAAVAGDFRFWKEIVDRVDGPVKQIVEQRSHMKLVGKDFPLEEMTREA